LRRGNSSLLVHYIIQAYTYKFMVPLLALRRLCYINVPLHT
jgi:hypothetical protein